MVVATGENGHVESNAPWLVHDGTVDFKRRPADKRHTGGWKAAPLIFVTEMCERLAAFGIGLNLVTYLVSNLHLPVAFSANIVTNYLGTAYLTCLLGGYIADTYIGRFWTIFLGAVLQFLGMVVLTLSATLPAFRMPHCDSTPGSSNPCEPAKGWTMVILYAGLYMVAFGTGGIKSSVSALGADQFDETDPRERKLKSSYFNWFFMAIEFGAILSVTVFIYIQIKLGRGWGFGATAGAMLVAIAIFVAGAPLYRYQATLKGSPISQVVRVFAKAFRNRKLTLPPPQLLHETLDDSAEGFQKIRHTEQFRFLDKAAIIAHEPEAGAGTVKAQTKPATVTQVEEIKCVMRMLPIAFLTIIFYTVYAQMLTFTLEQGQTMERGQLGFDIPPASLAVFREISVMVILAMYGPKLVPLLRRFTGHERGLTTLQRIGVGLLMSILSMLAAAIMESQRRRIALAHGLQDSPKATVPMSVFWLAPQFMLLGAGEVFTIVGQLEFCYQESPIGMRSTSTAVFLCTISFGFFTSSALVSCVNHFTGHGGGQAWLVTNLNRSRLDYFYSVLLAITVVNFMAFVVCANWYKYKAKEPAMEIKLERVSPYEEVRNGDLK
ncbi:hypothetical protein KC19_4G082400 [Ceratodon purpureus]|uniref:Uncharacterized protein n=1 Tax=Ceratodon purpureus TaxID=3225 RepID=A0A8T0I807_CERPU|nr:hypothetical protein KC19_4G082400 [Ceratodon purpureus]